MSQRASRLVANSCVLSIILQCIIHCCHGKNLIKALLINSDVDSLQRAKVTYCSTIKYITHGGMQANIADDGDTFLTQFT